MDYSGVRPSSGAASLDFSSAVTFPTFCLHDGAAAAEDAAPYTDFQSRACEEESQRDSGPKPRVARNELPWVFNGGADSTLKGLWPLLFPFGHRKAVPQPFQG